MVIFTNFMCTSVCPLLWLLYDDETAWWILRHLQNSWNFPEREFVPAWDILFSLKSIHCKVIFHSLCERIHDQCTISTISYKWPQWKINKKPNWSTGKFMEGARVVIPYIKGISEQYRHTFAKYKVKVIFKGIRMHHGSKRSNSICSKYWHKLSL